jgi:hypothetical protein
MGFHICGMCGDKGRVPEHLLYSNHSSGDVTLVFQSGRAWVMPDMILHYVADHGWVPPAEFIADVMESELAEGRRIQTRSIQSSDKPTQVGYLTDEVIAGVAPDGFVRRLEELMLKAGQMNMRVQTKGMSGAMR